MSVWKHVLYYNIIVTTITYCSNNVSSLNIKNFTVRFGAHTHLTEQSRVCTVSSSQDELSWYLRK